LVFEGLANLLGAFNLSKTKKKNGFVFTPQSSKNQKRMSLNPTPLPPTLFFNIKRERGLVHNNPLPPPKKPKRKKKTGDKN
jgi:hypothetical protein